MVTLGGKKVRSFGCQKTRKAGEESAKTAPAA